ncbi:hypothetical protein [Planctomycetes bacterium Pan216]|uniref:hypothetical protein n=1 Tax=Kolteria novifilia TaxID=2527975 RepID=UPI00119E09A5
MNVFEAIARMLTVAQIAIRDKGEGWDASNEVDRLETAIGVTDDPVVAIDTGPTKAPVRMAEQHVESSALEEAPAEIQMRELLSANVVAHEGLARGHIDRMGEFWLKGCQFPFPAESPPPKRRLDAINKILKNNGKMEWESFKRELELKDSYARTLLTKIREDISDRDYPFMIDRAENKSVVIAKLDRTRVDEHIAECSATFSAS